MVDEEKKIVETRASKTTEAILARLEKTMDRMNKKMDDNYRELRSDISELRGDLLTKVQQNETNIASNTSEIEVLKTTVANLENLHEMKDRANDLIVKGIPVMSNEKPPQIYHKIALAIGYVANLVPSAEVFRMGKKKPGANYEPPILLRFCNKFERGSFYQKYFSHGQLKLSDVGFNVDQRIYMSENLSKLNQPIFAEAMRLKKEKKLFSVSTFHGITYVKPKQGDNSVPVKTLSELDHY
jgi:hypothetical protein